MPQPLCRKTTKCWYHTTPQHTIHTKAKEGNNPRSSHHCRVACSSSRPSCPRHRPACDRDRDRVQCLPERHDVSPRERTKWNSSGGNTREEQRMRSSQASAMASWCCGVASTHMISANAAYSIWNLECHTTLSQAYTAIRCRVSYKVSPFPCA